MEGWLYEHQKAAVMRMEEMETGEHTRMKDNEVLFSRVGIFADRRGTGRRRSVLALVARDKRSWDTTEPYTLEMIQDLWGDGQVVRRRTRSLRRLGATLVVCHRSRLRSWETEASQTGLRFRVLRSRKDLACIDGDLVICHTAVLPHLLETTRGLVWKRVVLDGRAHKTRPITGFTWCLWPDPSLFPGLSAEVSRHILVRNTERDFCLSVGLAPTLYLRHPCLPMYDPASLRFAPSDRPSYLVRCLGGSLFKATAAYTDCLVCLEDIVEPVVVRCCGRAYCGSCILQWLRLQWTCPACRSRLVPRMLLATRDDEDFPTRGEVLRSLAEKARLVVVATVPLERVERCVLWTEDIGSAVLSTHDLVIYQALPLGMIARITDRFHCIGRRKALTVHCLEDAPSRNAP